MKAAPTLTSLPNEILVMIVKTFLGDTMRDVLPLHELEVEVDKRYQELKVGLPRCMNVLLVCKSLREKVLATLCKETTVHYSSYLRPPCWQIPSEPPLVPVRVPSELFEKLYGNLDFALNLDCYTTLAVSPFSSAKKIYVRSTFQFFLTSFNWWVRYSCIPIYVLTLRRHDSLEGIRTKCVNHGTELNLFLTMACDCWDSKHLPPNGKGVIDPFELLDVSSISLLEMIIVQGGYVQWHGVKNKVGVWPCCDSMRRDVEYCVQESGSDVDDIHIHERGQCSAGMQTANSLDRDILDMKRRHYG